jgi:hypothetical protein
MPHGRLALTPTTDHYTTLIPDHQDMRLVFELLRHDAMFRAHQGDPDGALESCMALRNAVRVFDGDPFIISFLIRLVGDSMLVDSLERTLAQGHPTEAPLKEMQERLRTERDDMRGQWIQAVRGDRAMFHRFFELVRQRQIRLGQYMESQWRVRVTLRERILDYAPALAMKDFPEHLRHRNELVAAAQLPLEQQFDRFTALAEQVDRSDERKRQIAGLVPLLPPDLAKVCGAYLRGQAILAAAEAGLACERIRLAQGRWPEALTELVKAGFLKEVPADPFDGQPLRLVRLKDGLAIYSVAGDRKDEGGGEVQRDRWDEPGVDLGFRLWDPPQRRQGPLPPVAMP